MAAANAEQQGKWSNFWTLCRIEAGADGSGYLNQPLPPAQSFLQQCYPQALDDSARDHNEQSLCITLLEAFRNPQPERTGKVVKKESAKKETENQALCGLCLRCWVSHPMLLTCMKLANLFGASGQFGYRDLLPFVLTDDGRQRVVVKTKSEKPKNQKPKNQKPKSDDYQLIQADGQLAPLSYVSFSLRVLQTYRLASEHRLSLTNWTQLQTKQHPELIDYLAEFGFQKLSDWALLNRVRSGQMRQLSEHDQAIVVAFHDVYRRDRRLNAQSGRCPDPTEKQLVEMSVLLPVRKVGTGDLLRSLKQIATQLRQFDVWQAREPLEYFNAAEGGYQPRVELPATTEKTENIAEDDLMATLHQQLSVALSQSLKTTLSARIAKLKKSKKYGPFADEFGSALAAYYQKGLSLKEITPILGTSSWDQTRRILNPGELLNQVRTSTLQIFSSGVLKTIEEKSLAPWPPTPEYLQQLIIQLEQFADDELFQAAVAEMKAGSHRNL
ncbi:MAG: hypothetical protein ABG776_06775, partial [Cyanobacteria bacterium J06555_13]